MTCNCPNNAFWPWDCVDCPVHGADAEREAVAEAKAEHDAEYAWLRAAENPWPPDEEEAMYR